MRHDRANLKPREAQLTPIDNELQVVAVNVDVVGAVTSNPVFTSCDNTRISLEIVYCHLAN